MTNDSHNTSRPDEDAVERFSALFKQHSRAIYGHIRALVPNASDADDVFQETSVTLWQKFNYFQPGTDFRAWSCRIAYYKVLKLRDRQVHSPRLYSPEFLNMLSEELIVMSDFLDAQAVRAAIAHGMALYTRRFDLLLTPATAVLPFEVGLYAPPRPAALGPVANHDWAWWTPFSWPFNLTQQPAIVLPCGFSDDDLPIAMQLVAPRHREDLCFRAAAAYEAATDWSGRRPSFMSS